MNKNDDNYIKVTYPDNTIEKKKDLQEKIIMNYIEKKDLQEQITLYKNTGKISEKLGKAFLDIAYHLLGHQKFRKYPEWLKYDMQSYAIEREIIALKTIKPEHNPFSYLTTCCYNAFIRVLQKHFKYEQFKAKLFDDTIRQFKIENNIPVNDSLYNNYNEE